MPAITRNVINETSFAMAYGDAVAKTLDAITLIGSSRKDRLDSARERLHDAAIWASMPEERILINTLDAALKRFELGGMNV